MGSPSSSSAFRGAPWVTLIVRDGETFVPEQYTTIRHGDQLLIVTTGFPQGDGGADPGAEPPRPVGRLAVGRTRARP